VTRPMLVGRPPVLFGPTERVRWGESAQVLPFDPKPDQVPSENHCSLTAPFSIYQFGHPFSNSFGGIALWYVTLSPIQFIFYMMLYILGSMLFLVSHIMHETMDLQILSWYDL
jgi:hypothetical protein